MYVLQVERMKCGGCAGRVTKAVQAIDNAAKVDVDLANKSVRVDSQANVEAIVSAIATTGYPATVKVPA
ncbi:heavy-metal-associated domain-containing protein [Noviherbaspirillum massiliense]|uniref:heavy-metal-associated domain-containing protein n=1 Tax=Noviherbaspirillum massiliense TaxID=1465823 RepID=UPI0002E34838|nr:heavy-metal-associated domain-containing protein [Noviherbaspirillum massiliense]